MWALSQPRSAMSSSRPKLRVEVPGDRPAEVDLPDVEGEADAAVEMHEAEAGVAGAEWSNWPSGPGHGRGPGRPAPGRQACRDAGRRRRACFVGGVDRVDAPVGRAGADLAGAREEDDGLEPGGGVERRLGVDADAEVGRAGGGIGGRGSCGRRSSGVSSGGAVGFLAGEQAVEGAGGRRGRARGRRRRGRRCRCATPRAGAEAGDEGRELGLGEDRLGRRGEPRALVRGAGVEARRSGRRRGARRGSRARGAAASASRAAASRSSAASAAARAGSVGADRAAPGAEGGGGVEAEVEAQLVEALGSGLGGRRLPAARRGGGAAGVGADERALVAGGVEAEFVEDRPVARVGRRRRPARRRRPRRASSGCRRGRSWRGRARGSATAAATASRRASASARLRSTRPAGSQASKRRALRRRQGGAEADAR